MEKLYADRYSMEKVKLDRFRTRIKVVDHKKGKTYEATKDGLAFSAATSGDIWYVKKVLQLEAEGK